MQAITSNSIKKNIPFRNIVITLSVTVIVLALGVIVGWLFNIPVLKSINPDWIAMRVNSAFCFILSSVSLLLFMLAKPFSLNTKIHMAGKILAAIACIFGILTLLQFMTGLDLKIDNLLFVHDRNVLKIAGSLPPGRMAANTSLNFLLAGLSLFFLHTRKKFSIKFSQWSSVVILAISLPALIGYCYGAKFEGGLAYYTQMAIHTSLFFILFGVALAFAKVDAGFMSTFSRKDAGGVIARNLIPVVIVVPFLSVLIVLVGLNQHLYDIYYAMTLAVIIGILIMCMVVFRNANLVSKLDADIYETNINLEKIVKMRTAQFKEAEKLAHLGSWEWDKADSTVYWSEELYRIFDIPPEEVQVDLETYFKHCHPDDESRVRDYFLKSFHTKGVFEFEHRIITKKGEIKNLYCQGEISVENGVTTKLFGIAQDITLRKKLEDELTKAKDIAVAAVVICHQPQL